MNTLKTFLWSLAFFCVSIPSPAQTEKTKEPILKNWEFHAGAGIRYSFGSTQLKKHLDKNGYNDSSSADIFGLKSKSQYPRSSSKPFIIQLGFNYRLSENYFLGNLSGYSASTEATGLVRTGYWDGIFLNYTLGQFLELKNRYYFTSLYFGRIAPDGRSRFQIGPALQFHNSSINWKGTRTESHRSFSAGAMASWEINISKHFNWFFSFHWMPNVEFAASCKYPEGKSRTGNFQIEKGKIGFSYLGTGMIFRLFQPSHQKNGS